MARYICKTCRKDFQGEHGLAVHRGRVHTVGRKVELPVTPEGNKIDMVNSPPHYNTGAVECIEAIRASMSGIQYRGYMKGCVMKYLWRWEHKGGVEDLKKAQWYLGQLIQATGEVNNENS